MRKIKGIVWKERDNRRKILGVLVVSLIMAILLTVISGLFKAPFTLEGLPPGSQSYGVPVAWGGMAVEIAELPEMFGLFAQISAYLMGFIIDIIFWFGFMLLIFLLLAVAKTVREQ